MAKPRPDGATWTSDSDSATPKTYSKHSKTPRSETFFFVGLYYCYTTDSEYSDEENIIAQQCPTKSNNTTKSSLETSLNVSGQKICDDTNLHIDCSKLGGLQKQNFCYYCKKMQSKISRHLERAHKNEKEVEKFITLP